MRVVSPPPAPAPEATRWVPRLGLLGGLCLGLVVLWLAWEVRGVNGSLAQAATASASQARETNALLASIARGEPTPTKKAPARLGTTTRRTPRPASSPLSLGAAPPGIDLEECLAQVKPGTFPSDVKIEDLRAQLRFAWGSKVPLDPRTGRPLTATTLWDRYNGSVQAHEPSGTGGWVVVPRPEVNVPAGQLPPSYWGNKQAEMRRLELCVERARLVRSLFDPLWEQRELIGMAEAAQPEEGDE